MDKVLTIQIPTYRNLRQLSDCLTSLITYTEFPFQIVVINNDGADFGKKAVEDLLSRYPSDLVRVIHAGANLGWMGAQNLALKECETPLVCLLNDDVVFLPHYREFWRQLCGFFRWENIGAVGPCSNFVMGGQNLWRFDLPPNCATTLLIGFCVVMRTQLIKDLGGLDESLPGGDDLDWSIRIRDAGYELIIDRSAYLHHIGQQTGKRVKSDWDSLEAQDITNNALIRKHGVLKWFECISCACWSVAAGNSDVETEKKWVEDRYVYHNDLNQKGISLGCGARDIGTYGLDIARKGEKGAGGRKYEGAIPDITANALDLPVTTSSLDYLLASHLLEHLVDPYYALDEWKRALKPDGVLYLTMPNHDQLPTMLIDYTHVHAYTPESAQNMLARAGWEVEEVCTFSNSGAFGIVARPQTQQKDVEVLSDHREAVV